MCLAIPMKVISINGESGEVEVGGIIYKVNFRLVPGITINDYVIVHAGFAIEKLNTLMNSGIKM